MAQKSSKNLSYIGENIKKIRTAKNISQAEFANLFDLGRASVGAYEEGRSEPKIDTIIQIANTFSVSIDVLLKRELTVAEIFSLGLVNEKLNRAHKLAEGAAQKALASEIPLLRYGEFVNYLVQGENQDFVKSLPTITVPETNSALMAFEVEGSSMQYGNQGLQHGDFLICQKKNAKHNPIEGHLSVVVTNNEVTIRRVSENESFYTLKCDDPGYEANRITKEELKELWIGVAVYSRNLSGPSNLEKRVIEIEKKLGKLS